MPAAEMTCAARWEPFWPVLLHPMKVAIIEALAWVDEPMSAIHFHKAFEGECWSLNLVSHHLRSMQKSGLLAVTRVRRVRGSTQTFFFFPDE